MTWNKEEQKGEPVLNKPHLATILAAETLRGSAPPVVVASERSKGEERISVFWRVFGGTLLSIAALVAVTVYQQITGNIGDLRSDLNRMSESRGDLIKKDEFNNRMSSVWNSVKEIQAANALTSASRERLALLEQQLKTAEEERKELTKELQQLRERLAVVEGRMAPSPERK